MSNFGELKDLFVVDNLSEHLIGNVYAKFFDEKASKNAFDNLQGKYYHTDLVVEEYCPIINPKDGKCYKYEDGLCNKGPHCNFLHFKEILNSEYATQYTSDNSISIVLVSFWTFVDIE